MMPAAVAEWVDEETRRRKQRLCGVVDEAKTALTDGGIRASVDVFATDDLRGDVLSYARRHNVDAIVIGARDLGVVQRALLGSLSTFLLQHAAVPVIVC